MIYTCHSHTRNYTNPTSYRTSVRSGILESPLYHTVYTHIPVNISEPSLYACIYCKEPIKNFLESNVTTSVKFKNFYLNMYILFEQVFCYLSFQIINVIISRNLLHNVTPNVWIYISLFRVKKKICKQCSSLITLVNVFTILRYNVYTCIRCLYIYIYI